METLNKQHETLIIRSETSHKTENAKNGKRHDTIDIKCETRYTSMVDTYLFRSPTLILQRLLFLIFH